MKQLTIRTSEQGWLAKLAEAYKKRASIILMDDAQVGIDPRTETILQMGRRGKLSHREWAGVLVSLGMGAAGIWLVKAAIMDPEPTSKLGLLLGGGVLCILGGGFSTIRILTRMRPPSVTVTKNGFKIKWQD